MSDTIQDVYEFICVILGGLLVAWNWKIAIGSMLAVIIIEIRKLNRAHSLNQPLNNKE